MQRLQRAAGNYTHRGSRWALLATANTGYAAALIIPFFVPQLRLVFTVLPPAALLGAAIVTLSFPLILQLRPNRNRGGYSGLFEFARGLGAVAGPLVTGGAIQLYALADDQYQGYPAMWLVPSIASALAALVLYGASTRRLTSANLSTPSPYLASLPRPRKSAATNSTALTAIRPKMSG